MASFHNVTIRQISEKANVSVATVSRALNGTAPVRRVTMDRINKAIEELSPGTGAPSMPTPQDRIILASFPDLTNPFNSGLIQGMQNAASQHGYKIVFFVNERYYLEESYIQFKAFYSYAGILLAHNVPNADIVERLNAIVPVVMCSEHISGNKIPYVAINDYSAACSAVNYLISTGRKRIACINSSLMNNYAVHRERGYRDCLKEAGLPVDERMIVHLTDVDYDLARNSIEGILSLDEQPDAFFCVSDTFAAAAVNVLSSKGYAVPGDVAVTGFDDIDLATMTTPPLTTVRQPRFQLGRQACNILIEQIEKPGGNIGKVILNTDLIVRGTT